MKISILCFTLNGYGTAVRLRDGFGQAGYQVSVDVKSRYLPDSIKESSREWAGDRFADSDAILFIGATGIAVRSIAPYIVSKKSDPAVLVVDEKGIFVISLLSGHLGGANELTDLAAGILGATPVVTTATDLNGCFAVDVFAKKNNCRIFNMKAAKEVSAAILAGETVGFYSEEPIEGELPEGLVLCDADGQIRKTSEHPGQGKEDLHPGVPRVGVAVTTHKDCQPFTETVVLVPQVLVLGVGCRRGREAEAIRSAAQACLDGQNFCPEALCAIASIDLKKEEPGILALAAEYQVPYHTYPEEALRAVPGEFTPSAFVQKVTGVDNVCERSAILASEGGVLLQKKAPAEGVTTALARKKGGVTF
jgi:cobalt-precorrin 5A hydrolase